MKTSSRFEYLSPETRTVIINLKRAMLVLYTSGATMTNEGYDTNETNLDFYDYDE